MSGEHHGHTRDRLVHQGWIYGSDEEFLAGAVPFLRDGVRRGESVAAVTGQAKLRRLREALGADAEHVRLVDNAGPYHDPAPTLAASAGRLRARPQRVRALSELAWGVMSTAQATEWQRYDAVANAAFAGTGLWVVCAFDRRTLGEDHLTAARRTHPELVTGGRWPATDTPPPNPDYDDPAAFAAEWGRPPLLPRPDDVPPLPFSGPGDLRRLREVVAARAGRAGLSQQRAAELVMSVNEVLTNALVHGGGRGDLRLWAAGGALACEVSDPGRWPDPALAGYLPPGPGAPSGGGLWLARRLCDRVDVRTGPHGSTVRLQVTLPAPD